MEKRKYKELRIKTIKLANKKGQTIDIEFNPFDVRLFTDKKIGECPFDLPEGTINTNENATILNGDQKIEMNQIVASKINEIRRRKEGFDTLIVDGEKFSKGKKRYVNITVSPLNKHEKVVHGVIIAFLIFFCFCIIYPFLNIIAISFSGESAITQGKVTFYPIDPTGWAYQMLFSNKNLYNAYGNSIFVALVGCALSLVLLCFAAYPLAFGKFKGKKFLSKFIVLTMFLSAGTIPNYLVIVSLHLAGSVWSLILSGLLTAYNIIIIRSYFESLPKALIESAKIDGANDFSILFKIVIPCSFPILATVALWIIVGHWNSYATPLVYLTPVGVGTGGGDTYTLQTFLGEMVSSLTNSAGGTMSEYSEAQRKALTYAGILLSLIPMIALFPFAQKFLVQGVTLGSVKE